MSGEKRSIRQAVILAGGLGTRLGSLTEKTPKPLLEVNGRPFLAYLIEWLARAGIEDIVISTGYRPEAFASFLASNTWLGPYGQAVKVSEAHETLRAGTAGALSIMRDRLEPHFLLVNGDTFFDCDLPSILEKAESLPPDGTLMVGRQVSDISRYGGLTVNGAGRVMQFVEKGAVGPGIINAGISVHSRSVTDMVGALPCSIETEIYPQLAAMGRLHCIEQSGYFVDIGLPETYQQAQSDLPMVLRKPAIIFDRDGVLNIDAGYTHRPEDLVFMQGAEAAVRLARAAGYRTVVVSNQAGVAKGFYTEEAVTVFHRFMNDRLRAAGAWVDAFYYCPFHPAATIARYRKTHPDRKPGPGMILRALRDLNLDAQASFLVGNEETDVAAATAAGIAGHLYTSGPLDEFIAELIDERAFGIGQTSGSSREQVGGKSL